MIKWILIGWSFTFSMVLQSQIEFRNLPELLAYADEHSVVARQEKILVAVGEQEIGIQRSGLLPKVNLYGTADYYPIIATQLIPESVFGGQDGKFRKVQFGLPYSFSTGVELSFPVINFEKWKQLGKAKLQSVQAGWTQKTNVEALHIQLTQLYYQVLGVKAAVKLNQKNQEVARRLIQIMEERKSSGILNPADYNRSRNLQLDILHTGTEYERLLEQALIAMESKLNLPDSVHLVIFDSLPTFDWPMLDIEVKNISKRPAWNEANTKVDVAKKAFEESQKAGFPRLSFYGRYAYNWQMKFTNNTNIGFDVSSIGLRLDFPVFQGNYFRTQQKKNDLLLQSAYLDKEKARSSLQQQQKEWENNYAKAFGQHRVLLDKTKVANDNLRIAGLNMREGVMEFNEFNEIFMEYNTAELDYLQNLFDGILYFLLLTENIQK